MKKYVWLFLLPILFCSFSKSDSIDISNFDSKKLEDIVFEKVNKLRIKKGKQALLKNDILKKAAQNQADYLLSKRKLTHNQRNRSRRTPMKRVNFYQGDFSIVGENIASTHVLKRVSSPKSRRIVVLKTYEELGEFLFQLWKNSKSHYENLLDNSYSYTGISFSINTNTNRVCSVQVFGYR